MGRDLRAGPASMAGLEWLARVGPAPMDAWACAMRWGERAARSHAKRLEHERWLERRRMIRGEGALLLATRRGVRVTGLDVTAPSPPRPASWAYAVAGAWTAAWCARTGADWLGPRETSGDPELTGEIEYGAGRSRRTAAHHPDLALWISQGLALVEVEPHPQDSKRLCAVLTLYWAWYIKGRIAGVLYVCKQEADIERIEGCAESAGFPAGRLRVETVGTIRAWAARATGHQEQAGAGPAA